MQKPWLSVVVNFHNMRREAPRTLYSLSADYQQDVSPSDYQVVAIDNGSSEPLDPETVRQFGPNFRYHFEATNSRSPSAAINRAVREADSEYICVVIDGARILSPGVLELAKRAVSMHQRCFIYTLSMHLGPEIQNSSLKAGYDERAEDQLLQTANWQSNGYRLFGISTVAPSSGKGFFSSLVESNCVFLRREDYVQGGGMDEAFQSPGGGLANLEFFERVMSLREVQPIMLLGEATFHQFHGGVATNVPLERHPWESFDEEHRRIRGVEFRPSTRAPLYFGHYQSEYSWLYIS